MRIFLTLITCLAVFSASANLVFPGDTLDFGTFKEEEGKKTLRIELVNLSKKPAVIAHIRTTCGCTATNHYEGEIVPGDSAWVDVTYNPNGRPGKFRKSIKVYTNSPEPLVIPIKGVVIGTPETMKTLYPAQAGPLLLTEKTLMEPAVMHGDSKYFFINAYNTSDLAVTPIVKSDSEALECTLYPATIPPGEIGTLGIYLNTRKEERTGPVEYSIRFLPDGEGAAENEETITLHVNISASL